MSLLDAANSTLGGQHIKMPIAFKDLFQPMRHKAYHGGRGGGKSHAMATILVIRGAQEEIRWIFAREIHKSLNTSVYQLLVDKIRECGLNSHYTITKEGIFGANGTKFLFIGLRSNPDSVRSVEGIDGVWVEEAVNVSQVSLNLLLPSVRKKGSEVWFSWNPRFETDPVDNMFRGGEPPDKSIIQEVNWRDNQFFPQELYDQMMWMKRRDPDMWEHIWEGKYLQRSDARVMRNWRVEDVDEFIPPNLTPYLGADWGFSQDPTVLIELFVFDRTIYIRREAWGLQVPIDYTPALFAGNDWKIPPRWVNPKGYKGIESARRNVRVTADSARPETIEYMKSRGFNIRKAIKGAKSVEEGVEFVNSYDTVIHPSCIHVQDEFLGYKYKVDKLTDEVTSQLEDRKNHTIDAVRYALENIRRKRRRPAGIGPKKGSSVFIQQVYR